MNTTQQSNNQTIMTQPNAIAQVVPCLASLHPSSQHVFAASLDKIDPIVSTA